MVKRLGTLGGLLLSAGLAYGGICTGLIDGSACLLADGQTVGTCFNAACTRTFTVPAGEARTGTGTIDIAADGTVTGTSTIFTQELHPGDIIQCSGSTYPYSVFMIVSDTTAGTLGACAAGGGACPTCTGAAFTYRNPIQTYLDESGNIKGLIDGLGRFAVGMPVVVATYNSFHPDLGTTSSGDGKAEDPFLVFSASGGQATSAAGATGGRGADIQWGTGPGGQATGTGSTHGGAGGQYNYSAGNGGDDTGSGNAGDAGVYNIETGSGGNANSGAGGKGGSVHITAHGGGNSTSGTAGDGGDVEITSGGRGSGTGGTPGHVNVTSAGTATMGASTTASLTGSDVNLTASNDVNITPSARMVCTVGNDTTIATGHDMVFTAVRDASITATRDLHLTGTSTASLAGADVSLTASNDISHTATRDVNLTATRNVNISGAGVNLAGAVAANSVPVGPVSAPINLGAQAADISDTSITGTALSGNFRISVYLNDESASVAAGAMTAHIKFNDGAISQDVTIGPVVLTSAGAMAQATIFARNAGSAITYGTTHTGIFSTATYHLSIVAEQVSN